MNAARHASEDPRARARARFAELVQDGHADPPLVETALAIALEEYPELPVRAYLARLHAFSSVVADRVREAVLTRSQEPLTVSDRLRILNHYVFEDLGFRGNREAYHDPRNSFLNDVVDRRLGIPITLSVIYMELAKGAGLRLAGVGFPGHFLVKTQGVYPVRLIDPFNGGAELGIEEVGQRLRELQKNGVETTEALRSVDNRSIVRRLLLNLKAIYLRENQHERALAVVERLLLLTPDSPQELLELGLLRGELGRYEEGIQALERYREVAPDAQDGEKIDATLTRMRYWSSRRN